MKRWWILMFTACAAPATYDTEECASLDLQALPEALEEHTCSHVNYGPYATQSAPDDPQTSQANVSPPHTAYTVTLEESVDGRHRGTALFRPTRASRFVVFLGSANVPLVVFDETNTELCPDARVGRGVCPALLGGVVIALDAGTTYQLRLGPASAREVLLLIEDLEEYE